MAVLVKVSNEMQGTCDPDDPKYRVRVGAIEQVTRTPKTERIPKESHKNVSVGKITHIEESEIHILYPGESVEIYIFKGKSLEVELFEDEKFGTEEEPRTKKRTALKV